MWRRGEGRRRGREIDKKFTWNTKQLQTKYAACWEQPSGNACNHRSMQWCNGHPDNTSKKEEDGKMMEKIRSEKRLGWHRTVWWYAREHVASRKPGCVHCHPGDLNGIDEGIFSFMCSSLFLARVELAICNTIFPLNQRKLPINPTQECTACRRRVGRAYCSSLVSHRLRFFS